MTFLLFWFAFSLIPATLAQRKGRSGLNWFLISCVVSPLVATIFLWAFASDLTHAPCPWCAEMIHLGAKICPHCRNPVEAVDVVKKEPPATIVRALSRKCPHCAELIKVEARVCRYCGREVQVAPDTRDLGGQAPESSADQSAQAPVSPPPASMWHLVVDAPAGGPRTTLLDVLRRDQPGTMDNMMTVINEKQVKVGPGLSVEQANALMARLLEVGIASIKQRDPSCRMCGAAVPPAATSCPACGVMGPVRNLPTVAGWDRRE